MLSKYEVEINGYRTTVLLSDEEAEQRGLVKAKPAPANKAAKKPANKAAK